MKTNSGTTSPINAFDTFPKRQNWINIIITMVSLDVHYMD